MTGRLEEARFGATVLPPEQHDALRRARRLEWISLGYLATCIGLVYLVMGSSQSMKVAWVEDLLSLIPPLAFLVASRRARRPPTPGHPYGFHRSVGSGHLAAAVALLAMGVVLVFDSASGLIAREHPPIGSFHLAGHTIWAGWLMIAVMVYACVGPVILGRLKMPLSDKLHDKVLYADADMNKADWMTAAAAIAGVLGIAVGLWWADAVAALVISTSILRDGLRGVRGAVRDLMDAQARTFDDKRPHPLIDTVLAEADATPWVMQAGCRLRDEGHVFHAEVFVVASRPVDAADCDGLAQRMRALDWKLDDIVIVPVAVLPDQVRRR